MMKKTAVLALVAPLLLVPTMAEPAHAANQVITKSCSKGGFTGWIRFTTNASHTKVYRIDYRIKKGKNKGGNNANVYFWDGGLLPAVTMGTGKAKQDNKWHVLRGGYTRGGGGNSAKFIFDKSKANDPSCTTKKVL